MIQRRSSRVLAIAGAGFLIGAAPAAATEGPSGPPLPNTLTPLMIPNTLPARAPTPRRALHPRVLKLQLVPKRMRHGKRGRLKLSLADSTSVRVVIARRVGKKYRHARTITASPVSDSVSLTLRSLPAGRYRVTVVSTGDNGARSRPVRRTLISTRR
jgi:hypothetical protein